MPDLFFKNKPTPYFVKALLYPFILLVILVILTVVIVRIGLGQVNKQNANIALAQKNLNILEQKELLLSQIQSTSTSQANILSIALPSTNPSLTLSLQIKRIAAESLVVLENMKIGGEVKKQGSSMINVNTELSGEIKSVLNFAKNIRNILPIINLDKIKVSQSGGLTNASIIIKGYWATYPTKMPAVIDPIKDFTKEENLTLEKILTLTQPQKLNFQPSLNLQRENPFE